MIYRSFALIYFFIENNLISQNQTVYKPGNSCISHPLIFTHGICESFDNDWEVKMLTIFQKFFEKYGLSVWYEKLRVKKYLKNAHSNKRLFCQSISKSCIKCKSVWMVSSKCQGCSRLNIFLCPRPFADETFIFVRDLHASANDWSNELVKFDEWAPSGDWIDPSKQAQNVNFSSQSKLQNQPYLIFYENHLIQSNCQNYLCVFIYKLVGLSCCLMPMFLLTN